MNLFGKPNIQKLSERHDVKGLIKALGNNDQVVRFQAIIAAEQLKDPEFVEPLLQLVYSYSENWESALRALGIIKNPRAVPPLRALLQEVGKSINSFISVDERFVDIAEKVVDTLTEMGDPIAVPEIMAVLQSRWPRLSKAALRALRLFGDQAVLPLAGAIAQSQEKEKMVEILGEIGTPTAWEQLEKMLDDEDKVVKGIVSKCFINRNRKPKGERASILVAIARWDSEELLAKGHVALPILESMFKEEYETSEPSCRNLRKCMWIASAMNNLGAWKKEFENVKEELENALVIELFSTNEFERQRSVREILEIGLTMEPVLTANITSFAKFVDVCREIRGEDAWALVRKAENRWFIDMLQGIYRRFGGTADQHYENIKQNLASHEHSEKYKETMGILIMLGDFSFADELVKNLFSGRGFEAYHLLSIAGVELPPKVVQKVYKRIIRGEATEGALLILKDLCDVRYLDAFLSALKHRDGGILRNAHDGILELLSNHGSIIDSKYAEILMNLPDKEYSYLYQSDYSWDQGTWTTEKFSMEQIRSKARAVLAGRVADK